MFERPEFIRVGLKPTGKKRAGFQNGSMSVDQIAVSGFLTGAFLISAKRALSPAGKKEQ